MATVGPTVGHPARHTELPRPSRRDPSSRIPAKLSASSAPPPAKPKLGASPSIGPSHGHFGYSSNKSNGNKSIRTKPRADVGDEYMDLTQPILNVPRRTAIPTPSSPQQVHGGSLTPSPSADTPPPPSLVSGSSASSSDSPRSNILRRKPSVIGRYVAEKQNVSRDSPFGRPLIQQIDGAGTQLHAQLEDPIQGDNVEHDLSANTLSTPTMQEPVELRYGADGTVVSRETPVSEASTSTSALLSTSPSQLSQSTAPTSLTSHSPMIGLSLPMGMRSFTSLPKKTSRRPSEPFGHPFFRQRNDSGIVSTTSLPRPRTAPQAPPSPIRERRAHAEPQVLNSISKKLDPVHPPELAHLNKTSQPPIEGAGSVLAPSRPSRNGTPTLTEHKKPRPVVQSGLPKLNTFQHRRKPSDNSSATSLAANETPCSAATPNARHTPLSTSDSDSKKLTSFRNTSQTSLHSHQLDRSATHSSQSKTLDVAPKSKSRFGFFSRKGKQETSSSKEAAKTGRKGPTAGTGHEGYGKRPVRIRSDSSSSTGSASGIRSAFEKRKGSGGSSSSKSSDLDEFLQQRLSPVYLRGEGKDSESQGRTSGSAFEAPSVFTPSVRSRETSHTSASSFELPRAIADSPQKPNSTFQGPFPAQEKPPSRGRETNEHSLELPATTKHRSLSRKRLAKPRPAAKESALKHVEVQSPTTADEQAPRPSTSSRLARVESHESTQEVKSSKSHWSLFPKASKESKPSSNKWTIFGKSKAESSMSPDKDSSSQDSMSASTNIPAHYLSADEPTDVNVTDLENIMKEAAERADDVSSVCTNFEDTDEEIILQVGVAGQRRLSSLGYSHSTSANLSQSDISSNKMDATQAQHTSSGNTPQVSVAPKSTVRKPSRLHPVGRIPPVTSRAEHVQKPPMLNFSRPITQTSPKPDAHSPSVSTTETSFPPNLEEVSNASFSGSGRANHVVARLSKSEVELPLKLKTGPNDLAPQPLFEFPPRKNSDNSYSSSSVSGTMHFPTATTIAHGPGRNSHASKDETWPEFDDLIDHVLTPSPTSSHQSKQYFEKPESAKRASNELVPPAVAAFPKLGTVETFPYPSRSSGKSPTKASVVVDTPSQSVGVIAAALRDPPSVSTIGSRRTNSLCYSYHSQDSARSSLKHKRSNSLPQGFAASTNDLKRSSPEVIIHENPFMFRYRVLMTSKWLSFGRLLFSPVHDDLSSPDDRVLVIDGLGNRDWSYYCAVSYPQTQVYSLGPSAPSANTGRASLGNFGNLANYRHFCYTTPGTDFPFPKGFFAAVVYRFPTVDSDLVMRAMISECKRVLRPGGYLEISAIDFDLANMGSMSRRAVRNLKTQIHTLDPNISLKPASDSIQSLIGRRGFENLSRCVVGVPAAGVIASSRENSADDGDMDFSRLASDNSKESDDNITKMVSQVGRWWYTQCYETAVLPGGDPTKSMWCDRQLLKECEELNTTFKLLICYAQKPSCMKRRTVSV